MLQSNCTSTNFYFASLLNDSILNTRLLCIYAYCYKLLDGIKNVF